MDEFGTEEPKNQDDKPIPFENGLEVSHAPLDLGGSAPTESSEPEAPAVVQESSKKVSWPDRITGVKTFYAKLHSGAIDFLNEQICAWLRDNPGVLVKRTDVVTGDVVGKKTEPNIIVTIWY